MHRRPSSRRRRDSAALEQLVDESAPTRRAARPTTATQRGASPSRSATASSETKRRASGTRAPDVRSSRRSAHRPGSSTRPPPSASRGARRRAAATRRPRSPSRRARSRAARSLIAHACSSARGRRARSRPGSKSPSSAPLVMALIAGPWSARLMMSMPTWLSVAGPVTTAGSMPNSSRSSLTPPQAADRIVGAQHHGRQHFADLGVAQDRLDAVGAEQAVAELEDDRHRAVSVRVGQAGCA